MGRSRKEKSGSGENPGVRPSSRLSVSVDEELDLHGMAVDEALVQVEMALGRHRGRGSTLRLIHGHSSGDVGSIRGALRRSLETVWKKQIRAFRPEPGNPGATLVLLA